jgi:hypothetical protein
LVESFVMVFLCVGIGQCVAVLELDEDSFHFWKLPGNPGVAASSLSYSAFLREPPRLPLVCGTES